MKFTEAKLEQAIITLLAEQGFPHVSGTTLSGSNGAPAPLNDLNRNAAGATSLPEVLIKDDLRAFLRKQYAGDEISEGEINSVITKLESYAASDLYASNKAIMKLVCDGFLLKREDHTKKDLYIQLIDYSDLPAHNKPKVGEVPTIVAEDEVNYNAAGATFSQNIFKFVTQLEILGKEKRIPDGILYINGIPLVVFEFKSAIREEANLFQAYEQLSVRYARDIPELMKYHAFCVISDGVNNKIGSIFGKYDFFYPWRKVTGDEVIEKDGINSLHTMIEGLFDQRRLVDVIRNFVHFPDVSREEVKIVCRYPQYYAARKLFANILLHRMIPGSNGAPAPLNDSNKHTAGATSLSDGKGGTYFGATGCGKSYTMLFLSRLLMKSVEFSSPTIVLITDRTDLDSQLSDQFSNAKGYIGDADIESVKSRGDLRLKLKGRKSGGVFLTTVHKFNEDAELLTDRCNVICISDEAHRSQVNLDQKITVTDTEVKKSYGFAWHLHNSLPNATYVGFTGTPIDATLDVFGQVVDAYTMAESVKDEITVRLVYEGRAAKVLTDNSKLAEIEAYYKQCEEEGSSDYAVEQSKKVMASMKSILGDKDRLEALAKDFVTHYETRIAEGSTVMGKAMFVSSSRTIAFDFYKEVIKLLGERSSSCVTLNDFLGGRSSSCVNLKEALTTSFGDSKQWHTRNLPHRNKEGLIQSITFRLGDSMPKEVLDKIEAELNDSPKDQRSLELRKKQQFYLDQGAGCCALNHPEMAECVMNALRHHDGEKYDLLAWSIMPNHVHVLIHAKDDVSKAVQSWKSYTGKWAVKNNKRLKLGIPSAQKGLWQPEYWDRFIRDEEHFDNAVKYILENPTAAGLDKKSTASLYTGHTASAGTKRELHPSQIKMVMTRGKDDPQDLYDVLGTSEYRKMLDGQFKNAKSNFKIAIVVDMWLTGFDVPFLDTIYIDKPIKKHNLIQTISRVNRKFEGKDKGLVVDYFGIKSAMNQALAMYSKTDATNFEDVQLSITEVRNHLDLLGKLFHIFDSSPYFTGDSVAQLDCLNRATEFIQLTDKIEHRFMQLVKRLKAAYDVCCGAEEITEPERDQIHFYLAIRSIIAKLTKGDAPDTAQMNAKVAEMIEEAVKSDGVEEIFKLGNDQASEIDIFDEDYLTKISNIKLPNTKAKLLQQMLKKAIAELKKVNKMKGVDFSKKFNQVVDKYNERKEGEAWTAEGIDELTEEMINMFHDLAKEYNSDDMPDGIGDIEEKAFYDILKELAIKYSFDYPEDKLIALAKKVKDIVDDQAKFPDWSHRADIKAALKVNLIMALAKNGYPPVDRDEVYKEIFEQAENFKKYNG